MSRLDNYDMLEALEGQAPFTLPIGRTDRVRLIDELVRTIPPDVMGHALRSIATFHGLRLDDDVEEQEVEVDAGELAGETTSGPNYDPDPDLDGEYDPPDGALGEYYNW